MQISDALLAEHGLLYELFDHLRDTTLESDDLPAIRGAVAVLDRLLISHARIEDDLLFPPLESHLGPAGPLAVMREEHQEIEGLLAAARDETDVDALKSAIAEILELAEEHFHKEEIALFAMAREHLGEATLKEIGKVWASTRNVPVDG